MVAAYTDAEKAVVQGQSVRWGDRQLTRADLTAVREGRKEWERKLRDCEACANGATRQRFGGLNTSLADISGSDDREQEPRRGC